MFNKETIYKDAGRVKENLRMQIMLELAQWETTPLRPEGEKERLDTKTSRQGLKTRGGLQTGAVDLGKRT